MKAQDYSMWRILNSSAICQSKRLKLQDSTDDYALRDQLRIRDLVEGPLTNVSHDVLIRRALSLVRGEWR